MATQSPQPDTNDIDGDSLRKEILWATHKHLLDETIMQMREEKQGLVDANKKLSTENDELRLVNEELRDENEELQEVLRQIRQKLEGPSESRKRRRHTEVHEMEQEQRGRQGQAAALHPERRDADSPARQESPIFCEETAQEEEQADGASHTIPTSQPDSSVARSMFDTPASIKSETDSIIVRAPASRLSPSNHTHVSRNMEDEFDPSITIRLVSDTAQDDNQEPYDNVTVPDGVKKSVAAIINRAKAQSDGRPWITTLRSTYKCVSIKLSASKNCWVVGSERRLCCKTCFNGRRACIVVDAQDLETFAVLPLPPSVRPKDARPGDDGYYINSKHVSSQYLSESPWPAERSVKKRRVEQAN